MSLYVFNLLAILLTSILLFALGYRNAYSRWMGILLLVGGSINLTYCIHFTLLPWLKRHDWLSPALQQFLTIASIPGVYIHFYFLSYAFLVSAIYFTDFLPVRLKKLAAICLFVPIPLIMSVRSDFILPIEVEMVPLRFMAHFYTALGIVLYMFVQFKDNHSLEGTKKLTYVILLLVSILSENLNYYTIDNIQISFQSITFEINNFWKYNYINSSILLLCFIAFGISQGIWGIRLRVEQEKQSHSMRTLMVGTNILNHTIKNEIQKITYINEHVMDIVFEHKLDTAYDMLKDAKSVTDHLLDMAKRIKERADDIVLKESRVLLSTLLNTAAASWTPSRKGDVDIRIHMEADCELLCDNLHVRELFNNLAANAFDAIPMNGGSLCIHAKMERKHLVIEFRDNGGGIPKEALHSVFEPFFTTKRSTINYGLGLSYCYNVMQKHGGSIRIANSQPDQGTTVEVVFPAKRFEPIRSELPSLGHSG